MGSDMKKRLLKSDAQAGQELSLNIETDGTTRVVNKQNFAPLIELNKHMANEWRPGSMTGTQRHMAHVAEIPNVVYNELVRKFGRPAENPKAWKRWLNDSENRVFRTGGGYI